MSHHVYHVYRSTLEAPVVTPKDIKVSWDHPLNTLPCLCGQHESYDSEPGAARSSFFACWSWSNTMCQLSPKNDLTQMWAKFHLYPFQDACCLVYLRSVAALSSPFWKLSHFHWGNLRCESIRTALYLQAFLSLCRAPVGWTESGTLNMAHICMRLRSLNLTVIVAFLAQDSWFSKHNFSKLYQYHFISFHQAYMVASWTQLMTFTFFPVLSCHGDIPITPWPFPRQTAEIQIARLWQQGRLWIQEILDPHMPYSRCLVKDLRKIRSRKLLKEWDS